MDTYSSIAMCAARLRVVEIENEICEALMGVRPLGIGIDKVSIAEDKLRKAKRQLLLLERDYVRFEQNGLSNTGSMGSDG